MKDKTSFLLKSLSIQGKRSEDNSNIHFIGIGGSGMSALASLLADYGLKISGSDAQESLFIHNLRKKGVLITIGHDGDNIPDNTCCIIYSAAIPEGNDERFKAKNLNIIQISYAEAIGIISRQLDTIAICGTHGKTTTTSMTATAFVASGQDPNVIVGARIHELHDMNYRLGKNPWLILESCEYQRSFLFYSPKIIIITNIEVDHLDYYQDKNDYMKAFGEFLDRLPPDGLVIANLDDLSVVEVVKSYLDRQPLARVEWYGENSKANFSFRYRSTGVELFHQGKYLGDLQMSIPGVHNVMNALAVIALCHTLDFDLSKVLPALSHFSGAERRFQLVGYTESMGKKIPVIDDYGHHPTEITVTLNAIHEKFGSEAKILCIFQPHQHSRTLALLEDFRKCFQAAHTVVIPNIYAARDSQTLKETMPVEKFVEELSAIHPDIRNGNGLKSTAQLVKKIAGQFDVIITMGAGDVSNVASMLI